MVPPSFEGVSVETFTKEIVGPGSPSGLVSRVIGGQLSRRFDSDLSLSGLSRQDRGSSPKPSFRK